ncbi:hypothetical protein ACQKLP_17140 [Chitinophaga sp. NPDC101104]|uniref:glycosyl-4,4'-diaponeurosporenoate acyltransferase CrtO family protein n=1 Tax=Chitinophaga sp. NPDC101104 TaxID=3390561 RepID=UPI003D086C08
MKTHILNQLINFFWMALCCAPLLWYWLLAGWDVWAWIFITVSCVMGLLPRSLLRWTQLATTRRGFEKLGVKAIRKLTQNGDWANAATGSAGNTVGNLAGAERYRATINMYERFHLICGFFFLFSGLHAFTFGHWILGTLNLATNLVFNVAAIILQQYNRLRIDNLLRSHTS